MLDNFSPIGFVARHMAIAAGAGLLGCFAEWADMPSEAVGLMVVSSAGVWVFTLFFRQTPTE